MYQLKRLINQIHFNSMPYSLLKLNFNKDFKLKICQCLNNSNKTNFSNLNLQIILQANNRIRYRLLKTLLILTNRIRIHLSKVRNNKHKLLFRLRIHKIIVLNLTWAYKINQVINRMIICFLLVPLEQRGDDIELI